MLTFRLAESGDVDLYFRWSNDIQVRNFSYNSAEIEYGKHIDWFSNRIQSSDAVLLLFMDESKPVGQIRYECKHGEWTVGISIDEQHRGKGYASKMLEMGSEYLFARIKSGVILAYIKHGNEASLKSFLKAGYELIELNILIGKAESYKLIKKR